MGRKEEANVTEVKAVLGEHTMAAMSGRDGKRVKIALGTPLRIERNRL
jgi:hypothetical protein